MRKPMPKSSWRICSVEGAGRKCGKPERAILYRLENGFSFVVSGLRRFLNVGLLRVGFGAEAWRQGGAIRFQGRGVRDADRAGRNRLKVYRLGIFSRLVFTDLGRFPFAKCTD